MRPGVLPSVPKSHQDGSSSISIPRQMTLTEALMDSDNHYDSKHAPSVAPKYIGTVADQRDMMTLGKKQVLRRNFRFITMLGFGSTVICSWEVILPVFVFVLTDGGYGTLFWGFIAVTVGMLLVYASLAEMVSMCPTAGGEWRKYLVMLTA